MRLVNRIKRAATYSASLPAPIGGWNARDALGEMDPLDAVTMLNFFPLTSDVMLRKGHTQWATGIPSQVESLLAYSGPTTEELFAVAGTSIYDVSSAGAVGAAVVTGLNNVRWQHINIATSGGNFLEAVNGVDDALVYDGSTWTNPAITNVASADLVHINLFKERVFFVEKESLKAWYLPVKSFQGAASLLDFRSVARRGGYLVAMGTWTIDAGFGVDDLAVWVTSEGEVIVYRGTDPASASTWALVGIWQLGAPIGRRCFMKYGGDMILICQDGVVPLSAYLQSSRVNPKVALTDKIQFAMAEAATTYSDNFGWDLLYYAKANMLLINVPVGEGAGQEQFAMNSITKAWGRFQDIDANCWELFQDEPFFGGDGFVGKFWNSLSDNDTNINGTAKQAFNYFRSRGQLKRWTMIRPILLTNGTPSLLGSIDVDFSDISSSALLAFSPIPYAQWDVDLWDTGLWGTDLVVQKAWQGVAGIGYCCAPRLEVAAKGIRVQWVATDLVMERGGIL